MWRHGLAQALRLTFGIFGAALLAAAVLSLAIAEAHAPFAATLLARLYDTLHFNFGISRASGLPVSVELANRLPVTLELIGLGAIVAFVLGLPLGLLLGASRTLRATAPLLHLPAAVPLFCVGLALIWAAKEWHWPLAAPGYLPVPALAASRHEWLRAFEAIALPVLTVGLAGAGAVELASRRALAQSIDEPYRRGLRRFGLPQFEIDLHYVAPRVAAEFACRLGDIVLALLGAAIVVESLFQWPGVAGFFLKAAALHDWAAAAPILFLFAAVKLLADLLGELAARGLTVPP
jgi:peptide/nickel transport system permease protein